MTPWVQEAVVKLSVTFIFVCDEDEEVLSLMTDAAVQTDTSPFLSPHVRQPGIHWCPRLFVLYGVLSAFNQTSQKAPVA